MLHFFNFKLSSASGIRTNYFAGFTSFFPILMVIWIIVLYLIVLLAIFITPGPAHIAAGPGSV
jgi:hypothetical protein